MQIRTKKFHESVRNKVANGFIHNLNTQTYLRFKADNNRVRSGLAQPVVVRQRLLIRLFQQTTNRSVRVYTPSLY